MSFQKILLLLLALCMVIPTLAACKKDKTSNETTTREDVNLFEEDDNNPNLDPIDGQGRDFRVLTRIYNDSYLFKYSEIEDTGEVGEPVNAAVVKRNQAIETKYNVGFVITKKNPSEIIPALDRDAKAGLHSYDLVMPIMNTAILASCNDLLTEWGLIPFVNETKDYWMGELYDRTTLGGYHFFCPGDLNISAYNTVQTVFFNKQMHKNLELESIYDLVKNDQWTVEKMKEMSLAAGKADANGNNGTPEGTYGLFAGVMVWEPLFYNTGLTLVTKDDSDLPSMSALENDSEFLFTTIENITKMMHEENACGITDQVGIKGPPMFTAGRSLFWIECLYGQFELTDMTTDYGIVPIPTWNAGDEYIANTHSGFSTVSCIPTGVVDLEMSGSILEDMAYYSQQIVIPEYYEKTIHLRGVRDSESYEMLDIIFEHIVVDLALVMSLTIGSDIRDILGNNLTDSIASRLTGNKDAYEAAIRDIAQTFCAAGAKQYGYQ